MKINELSSYRKSNTGVEAGAVDRSGFVHSAAPTIQPRARQAQPDLVMRGGRGLIIHALHRAEVNPTLGGVPIPV